MASRTVAGGRGEARDHRIHGTPPNFRPRQRSRRELTPLGIWYATPDRGRKTRATSYRWSLASLGPPA